MATGTIEKVTTTGGSGYCKLPDGTLICWGTVENGSDGYGEVTFPVAFINKTYAFNATPGYDSSHRNFDYRVFASVNATTNGIVYFRQMSMDMAYTSPAMAHWQAIGRWK